MRQLFHSCTMVTVGMLLTALLAPLGNYAGPGKQYFVSQEWKTWIEARDYCRMHYTEMVSISSSNEHQQVKSLISSMYKRHWIGLYLCTGNEWRWSNGNEVTYSLWNRGSPSNDPHQACVKMYYDSDGQWENENCTDTRPFICYQEAPLGTEASQKQTKGFAGESSTERLETAEDMTEASTSQIPYEFPSYCQPFVYTSTSSPTIDSPQATVPTTAKSTSEQSTTLYSSFYSSSEIFTSPAKTSRPLGTTHQASSPSASSPTSHQMTSRAGNCASYTLHLILERMSWSEARDHCLSAYTDLSSIPVADVQWAISKLLMYPDLSYGVWIGLRRSQVWGYWYWVNEEPSNFSYWGQGEPNNPLSEMCAMVSTSAGRNFTWEDECCRVKMPSICYTKTI